MSEDPNVCICATCKHIDSDDNSWTEYDCRACMMSGYDSYEETDPFE